MSKQTETARDEKTKEYFKQYYQANKEKGKAQSARYYQANKEKCKARSKQWREANRQKANGYRNVSESQWGSYAEKLVDYVDDSEYVQVEKQDFEFELNFN